MVHHSVRREFYEEAKKVFMDNLGSS